MGLVLNTNKPVTWCHLMAVLSWEAQCAIGTMFDQESQLSLVQVRNMSLERSAFKHFSQRRDERRYAFLDLHYCKYPQQHIKEPSSSMILILRLSSFSGMKCNPGRGYHI